MFGISGSEFIVILIVAILLLPSDKWPEVARFFGRIVRYVRLWAGKIQDGIDNLEDDIAKDLPIDKISKKTMTDMMETFSTPIKPKRKAKK